MKTLNIGKSKGGRPKGSTIAVKTDVKERLRAKDYDALDDLLEQRMASTDPILSFNIAKELASYSYPKLRAMEVNVSGQLQTTSDQAKETLALVDTILNSIKNERK